MMKKTLVISTFLMGLSFSVNAEELNTRPWFVVTGGATLASNESSDLSDDTDRVLSIGYGWDFSDYLAAEFNYSDLGDITYEASEADVHSRTVMASLLPNMKFDTMRLFGRVGVGAWSSEINYPSSSTNATETSQGFDPVIGAGLEVRLGRAITQWHLRAEWMRHFTVGEKSVTGETDIDTVQVGITFKH